MTMKIPLSRGLYATVDPSDYEALSAYKWMAKPFTTKRPGHYACRKANNTTIYMHREIMNPASRLVVDHVDGDGLNNTRENLRVTTKAGNAMNSAGRSASGYRGVVWNATRRRWRAYLTHPQGGRVYLGHHATAEAAARAYDSAVRAYRGDIAMLNFPELSA